MITTQIINDINKTLYKILRESFGEDDKDVQIIFGSPAEENLADDTKAGMYVFLYHVIEDSYSRNESNQIRDGGSGRLLSTRPPLQVNLSYMFTPISASVEGKDSLENVRSHSLIAKTMRSFYDNGLIDPRYFPADTVLGESQVRITPTHMNLEELTKIWSTFSKPFQLSICYEVSTLRIHSEEKPKEMNLAVKPPVLETIPIFSEKAMRDLKTKGGIFIKISPNPNRFNEISDIIPPFVQPGMAISVYGKDFRGKKVIVKIDDQVMDENSIVVVNENLIKVKIPSNSKPGISRISLKAERDGDGEDIEEEIFATFHILPTEPNPIEIIDIRPNQGKVGDIITLFGINFTKDSKVTIGIKDVSKATYVDSSQINIIIPDGLLPGIVILMIKKSDEDLDSKLFKIIST